MTEPEVASSDATNIQSSIARDGDEYLINGRKCRTSARRPAVQDRDLRGQDRSVGPHAQAAVDDPGPDGCERRHGQTDAQRLRLRRRAARPRRGHFENVRVPASNILLGEGRGFEIAQGRLGPGGSTGRMRTVGLTNARRAMCRRVKSTRRVRRLWPRWDDPRRHRRIADRNRAVAAAHASRRLI